MLIVCDEISMLSSEIAKALIDCINLFQDRKKTIINVCERKNSQNHLQKIINGKKSKKILQNLNVDKQKYVCEMVKKNIKNVKLKIVLLGDQHQLPPIECDNLDNISESFELSNKRNTLLLPKIFRTSKPDIQKIFRITRENLRNPRNYNDLSS